MHLIRHFQAQERQHQTQDLQDGSNLQASMQPQQPMTFLSVAPNTAIKTEPRDTSPLPYMYGNNYRLPEQSPSPQPSLSPSNLYNNPSNTPSPYGAGGQQNTNLISPNNQYIGGTAVGGSISPNIRMDMNDYGNYQQQQQYPQTSGINPFNQIGQQLSPQHQQQQQQQQWINDIKHPMPQINNLSSTNFNVNNLLMTTVPSSTNNNQRQAQQSQDPWHLSNCTTAPNANNNTNNNNNNNNNTYNVNQLITNNNNNNTHTQQHHVGQSVNNMNMTSEGPTLSSLLDMDSEQLMHLNSAELSGLSIS